MCAGDVTHRNQVNSHTLSIAHDWTLAAASWLRNLTKSCKVKMRGVIPVWRHFEKNYQSYDHENYTHVGGDPGLHADVFTFIRDAFVIKCQTSKLDAQGLFDRL